MTEWTNSTGSYPSYYNSAATTTGDYTNWLGTGTTSIVSNQFSYAQKYWYQTYTVPMPQPDPEVIRRHEEKLRRRQPLDRWFEQNEKRISERKKIEEAEASQLARRLLFEYLDEKNRNNFADEKPLEIESGIHQGVRYQIPHHDGRIKAWRGDKVVSELCLIVKAPEWIPHEDKLLTKLLYLRNDEALALRTANHFNQNENLLQGLS